MKSKILFLLVLGMAFMAIPGSVVAYAPSVMGVPLLLIDPTTKIPYDGAFNLTFKLYDNLTDGNLTWSEQQLDVYVEGGHRYITLGASQPLNSSIFSEQIYLELEICQDGSCQNTTRDKFTSVPYALSANNTDYLEGKSLGWIQSQIDAKASQTALDAEISFREANETDIRSLLSGETSSRQGNDSALSANISGVNGSLDTHTGDTSDPHSVTKSQVGLGSVENTALSSWAGSSSITTLGAIGTGTWQGTAITNSYIASGLAATKISTGTVSNTEFNYLNGVTSAIQTQLNSKASSSHAHALGDLSNVAATGEGSGGGFDADTLDNEHGSAFAKVTSGSYVGDDSTNRAIPHGLGRIPKMVIWYDDSVEVYMHFGLKPGEIRALRDSLRDEQAVTTWTSTNFYVGNPSNPRQAANGVGNTYYWVAIA